MGRRGAAGLAPHTGPPRVCAADGAVIGVGGPAGGRGLAVLRAERSEELQSVFIGPTLLELSVDRCEITAGRQGVEDVYSVCVWMLSYTDHCHSGPRAMCRKPIYISPITPCSSCLRLPHRVCRANENPNENQGRLRLTASRTGFHELIFLASSK